LTSPRPPRVAPRQDGLPGGWERFRASHGQEWRVHLDRRSGARSSPKDAGSPWAVAEGRASRRSRVRCARSSRATARCCWRMTRARARHGRLRSADPEVSQVVFEGRRGRAPGRRAVPLHGRPRQLVSFGTQRWSRIDADPTPDIDAAGATDRLSTYMGLTPADAVEIVVPPTLEFIPLRAGGPPAGAGARSVRGCAWLRGTRRPSSGASRCASPASSGPGSPWH
jgi:hypothetical protein